MSAMNEQDPRHQEGVAVKERPETRKPPMYHVIMHNDDYTPMEFVVGVLQVVFNKSVPVAHEIMLSVHKGGRGMCGVFPHEVAVAKMNKVHKMARANQFPLRCSVEAT